MRNVGSLKFLCGQNLDFSSAVCLLCIVLALVALAVLVSLILIILMESTEQDKLRAVVKARFDKMAKLIKDKIKEADQISKGAEGAKPRATFTIPKISSGSILHLSDNNRKATARRLAVDRFQSETYTSEELEKVWEVLTRNSNRGPPNISPKWWQENVEMILRENGDLLDEPYIDFLYFEKSKMELPEKFHKFFTPAIFCKLKKASEVVAQRMNRIRTMHLITYIHEWNFNKLIWVNLCRHDVSGTGFLTEETLKNFLMDYEPFKRNSELAVLSEYYITVGIRKLFFFLDSQRTGKIRIMDILTSKMLEDIHCPKESEKIEHRAGQVDWFSIVVANRIYLQFQKLDHDSVGRIGKPDMLLYSLDLRNSTSVQSDEVALPIILTPTFVDKLFSSVPTTNDRMEFPTFVEFVISMTYLKHPQSIMYFMRILDTTNKGYLDEMDLNYYYKDISKLCQQSEKVEFEDIRNDIFGIVNPKDPKRITAKDLIKCGKGDSVIKMLISVKGFEAFETTPTMEDTDGDSESDELGKWPGLSISDDIADEYLHELEFLKEIEKENVTPVDDAKSTTTTASVGWESLASDDTVDSNASAPDC